MSMFSRFKQLKAEEEYYLSKMHTQFYEADIIPNNNALRILKRIISNLVEIKRNYIFSPRSKRY